MFIKYSWITHWWILKVNTYTKGVCLCLLYFRGSYPRPLHLSSSAFTLVYSFSFVSSINFNIVLMETNSLPNRGVCLVSNVLQSQSVLYRAFNAAISNFTCSFRPYKLVVWSLFCYEVQMTEQFLLSYSFPFIHFMLN